MRAQGPFDDAFKGFVQPPLFYPTVKEVALTGEVRKAARFALRALSRSHFLLSFKLRIWCPLASVRKLQK